MVCVSWVSIGDITFQPDDKVLLSAVYCSAPSGDSYVLRFEPFPHITHRNDISANKAVRRVSTDLPGS